ncbi:ABC transporter domain-containing protein [Ditylenchus destructor]|nr:ABC transporter domain-containing protein [Ditylenchus destructor]
MGAYLFTYSLEAVYASALLMFLYGMSCILLVNILSSLFTSPTLAFALISCGMFFVGVVTTFVVMILELLMHADPGLRDAHKLCSKLFLLIPQYNLGMGIYRMAVFGGVVEQASIVLQMTGRSDMISMIPLPNALDWDVLGEHCVCLFALTIIYAAALLLVEYRSRFRFLRQMEKRRTQTLLKADSTSEKKHRFIDSDVIKEQELVDKIQEIDDYGLVVKHLSKAYGKRHLAVNNLSFAVGKGHCFGLLGVNGAGKTTTFSMLTGVLNTCQGDVFVNGNSIITDGDRCFRFLGYCPQIDALTAKITAREHLAFYARVRGIREEDVDLAVQWALDHMQLKPYADEISSSYSGGNKRKLAAAIALVGDPPVVLLDEPSAGMDPSTQQFMWNLILRLRRSRRTVIITSHSMEECEFLCTRIAIMVAGQFECIGSIQHLKERFGEGYTLTLKISSSDQIEETQKFIETHMTGAELRSIHCTTLFYRIHQMSNMALANIFRVINKMEDVIRIEDYSLSQTTLDDVFVSFASNSTSPTKQKNGETVNTTTQGQNGDVPLDKI